MIMPSKFRDFTSRLTVRTIAWTPRCLKLIILLAVGLELFFLFEHGLDTCNWILADGYLVPWSHSDPLAAVEAADGVETGKGDELIKSWKIEHKWENGRCSSKVYLPHEVQQCFEALSINAGQKFKVGFVGDHWIKDIFTIMSQYVKDPTSKSTVAPPFSARLESENFDIVLRWLPYMDNPRPFGVGSGLNLTDWRPNVVIGGAALWTILQQAKNDPSQFREYQDNLRIFGENAAAHPDRLTIWKLSPVYHMDALYVNDPQNMDYDSTNEALNYYNLAAQNILKEVPKQDAKIWSSDDSLIDSMTYYNRTALLDWKHYTNETLFYQMQMLLNVFCNKVTGESMCCSRFSFISYVITSPTWLCFYVLCFCEFFHVHIFLLIFIQRVLKSANQRLK